MDRSSANLPEFLTPKQVAVIFQVREVTVRLWLHRRLLKGVKIGGSWRVSRKSIEEFESGK